MRYKQKRTFLNPKFDQIAKFLPFCNPKFISIQGGIRVFPSILMTGFQKGYFVI